MTQIEKEIRNQIILVVSRIPKKNHDTSIQLTKQFEEIFKKLGGLRLGDFQLNNFRPNEEAGLTNIINILPTTQDEEVWVLKS
jgi:hypothetical protein